MFSRWIAATLFLSILGLLLASQAFWFWQARRALSRLRRRWLRWVLAAPVYSWFVLLAGVFLLVPLRWLQVGDAPVLLSLFAYLREPALMVPIGLWAVASVVSSLSVLLVQGIGRLPGVVRKLRHPREGQVAIDRRYFLQTATYAAGALPFVMVGYGFLRGRQRYTVEEVSVRLPDLPRALEGLRLVLLTDVHASPYMPLWEVRRAVGLADELEPDLVFHTGDFITSAGDPLSEAVDELSRVPARLGRFGCLGNHEIYARATDAATELFARRGVRILRGENVELKVNGARLNLIGVDYQRQPRGTAPARWKDSFLRGVESLTRTDALNILLTHNPNPFLRAAELGIQLTLAGHTHGGQVQVEILDTRWSPARFLTPFVSGLYQLPRVNVDKALSSYDRVGAEGEGAPPAFLYVSRGLGTVGAPIRLNAPPEITLLTLHQA